MSTRTMNRVDKAAPYFFASVTAFSAQLLIHGFWLALLVGFVSGFALLFLYYLLRAPVVQRDELRQIIRNHEAATGHQIDRTLNGN